MPTITLRSAVLDAPDVEALAAFYERLLGWPRTSEPGDPTWVRLAPADGAAGIAIQLEPDFVRPVWPADAAHQQMQQHLDLQVDDLDAALAHALGCGATLAGTQFEDDVRVCLDPAGHPFCLFVT